MPTVTEIINIAKVSQYLSIVAIQRGGVYGGGVDKKLPRLLYGVRKNVELVYGLDNSDTTITKTSNYLYALCGRFSMEAQNLLNGGGGGSLLHEVSPAGHGTWGVQGGNCGTGRTGRTTFRGGNPALR